jgi:hypothetical protein
MSKIALKGAATGTATFAIESPATNTNRTIILPDVSGDISIFVSGTKMLFQQTTAPTGWTKDTTHNNKALRVVSGTASSGGSVAFTTAFASQSVAGTVGDTTLSTSQIPSHNHAQADGNNANVAGASTFNMSTSNAVTKFNTANTGGGGSHNHTFTGTAINLAVQYVDLIIATKD